MTRRQRLLAQLAAGLVCFLALMPLASCGPEPGLPLPNPPRTEVQAAPQNPIPSYVRETLAYVRQHGYAPPAYVGGRVFGNYEGQLPRYNTRRKRIEYREWDVRPKAEGRTRGAERLITGNDGRAWYSPDHYRTFLEVK